MLVQEGNTVAFVDFGIFGVLRPFDQDILSGQIENLAVGRIDESLRYYRAQLSATDDSDIRGFRREACQVLQTWYDMSVRPGASLKERHIGQYIGQMVDISRRYRLRYDTSYVLYWRALNALDSTSLRLSPSFDMVAEPGSSLPSSPAADASRRARHRPRDAGTAGEHGSHRGTDDRRSPGPDGTRLAPGPLLHVLVGRDR